MFIYTDRLFVMDINNLMIKIFILFQFCLLCILWPTNKLLANVRITLKLLILFIFSILGLCIAINARDLMLLYMGIDYHLSLFIY